MVLHILTDFCFLAAAGFFSKGLVVTSHPGFFPGGLAAAALAFLLAFSGLFSAGAGFDSLVVGTVAAWTGAGRVFFFSLFQGPWLIAPAWPQAWSEIRRSGR